MGNETHIDMSVIEVSTGYAITVGGHVVDVMPATAIQDVPGGIPGATIDWLQRRLSTEAEA
jgi:hypothetical protein